MEENKRDRDIYDEDQYDSAESAEEISDDDLDLSELLAKYMLDPQDKEKEQEDAADALSADVPSEPEKDEDLAADLLSSFSQSVETDDDVADDIDASVYSEFASEVYSDEDAQRAASESADLFEGFAFDAKNGDEESDAVVTDDSVGFIDPSDLQFFTESDPASEPTEDGASEQIGAVSEDVAEFADVHDVRVFPETDLPAEPEADAAFEDDGAADFGLDYTDPHDIQYFPDSDLSAEPENQDAEAFDENGLFVDGSEYSDELADLSRFAEGDEPETVLNTDELLKEEAFSDPSGSDVFEADAADAISDGQSETGEGDFVDYEANEEPIEIDEDVDSTDINLMLAFGLDDELERTMGAETAQRLTEELDEEQRQRDEKVRKTVDNEYMNRSQTAGIAKEYKRRYFGIRIKLALGAIFALVLFFYENLRMFDLEFTGALDATVFPTVYIMISLQLLLFVCACAYEQLLTGIVRLFKGRPDARSVAAVATVAAIVYSALLSKLTVLAHRPLVVNFVVALFVLFTLVADYYNIRREMFAFNVVSAKRPKHVITKVEGITDPNSENGDGDILKFETAAFVDGYFTRTKEPTPAGKNYAVASLVIGLFAAAAAGFYTNFAAASPTLSSVVENAFCGFFMSLPVSMLISVSYPFFRAARDAYDADGAIVGECSLDEYSDARCVMFDDIGVFPSYGVRVQNIKIYNNHRIDRVLFYAASVFAVARGPLSDVFEMATVEIGHSDDVKIKAAGSGYLSASVDDKNITFGSAAELITRGFDIPEAVTDEDDFDEEDVSVMYMFREEKLMAKLFIKYSLDADFEAIMEALCAENISVSIKTYDPNIDNDLIAAGLKKDGGYLYSVTRYEGADDGSTVRDNADSGIVSRGSAKTLLELISACSKVITSRRACTVIGVISSIVAAALMLIVIASGRVDSLTSGILAIYQLFWLVPAYISARMYVR